MRIAILGAGNVGGALASAATAAGHEVTLSATDADKTRLVAEASGATAAASNVDAVQDAANGWPWQSAWKLVGPTGER